MTTAQQCLAQIAADLDDVFEERLMDFADQVVARGVTPAEFQFLLAWRYQTLTAARGELLTRGRAALQLATVH